MILVKAFAMYKGWLETPCELITITLKRIEVRYHIVW